MNEEIFREAFNASVRYLSYRQRTEDEVVKYLKKRDYIEEIILKVINRLREVNYIDDNKYAINYINTSIAKQNRGIDLIRKELLDKGIKERIVSTHLYLYPLEKELEFATSIATNYVLSRKEYPLNQLKNKIYIKLHRKGFSEDSIKAALKNLDQDKEVGKIIEEQQNQYEIDAISLAKKYYEKYSKKETNIYKIKEKIYGQLMRRGYDYQLSSKVVKDIIEEGNIE